MSVALLIARHEWRRLAVQPFAWGLAAVAVALMAWQFLLSLDGFVELAPKLGGLQHAPGATDLVAIALLRSWSSLLVLLVPLVTMRSFAGERRAQTLPLLLASGVGNARIVVGKYLGALGYVIGLTVLVASMPLALGFGAALDAGKVAAALLGLGLYAAALVAIGVACSAWTAQPALAAAAALAISSLLAVVDAGARLQGVDSSAINYLALPTHLQPFFLGLVGSVDVVYFGLVVVVALALATRRLDVLRTGD
ncbi:ABC transporter permease subunit [Dokdonella sp.]|uniref:ABC transporter permease n=1 Tax=Dokdonella sp. TaxID=2291710 RepID=UPI002609D78E|nr:ABC transporter permease subunit [Dokdonella sp.]